MIDIPAIKARLSDPREVARLLGLRVEQPLRNGVLCRCPVHNNKSGALRLQYKGGKLSMNCFGCGIFGDAIDLLAAMEGDSRRGLARAAELAGGAAPRTA
jgi:DNA primase